MNPVAVTNQTESVSADVVIIDDDDLTLEIVAWVLRSSKTRHQLFADPDMAMTYLCESLPRILIVDYYMPHINGIDFIKNLGVSVELASCSIYLCSAIQPARDQQAQLRDLGVSTLDKAILCDRRALLALVDSEQQVTGI